MEYKPKILKKIIIIGNGQTNTEDYLKLKAIAEAKGIVIVTAKEAQEAGINVPDDILPDHGIGITSDVYEINTIPLKPLEPIPQEFLIKNKRGKGKHKKTYDPPYRYHR
jgi:hypothetical protein